MKLKMTTGPISLEILGDAMHFSIPQGITVEVEAPDGEVISGETLPMNIAETIKNALNRAKEDPVSGD